MNAVIYRHMWTEPATIPCADVQEALDWATTKDADVVDILDGAGALAMRYYRGVMSRWFAGILDGKAVTIQVE